MDERPQEGRGFAAALRTAITARGVSLSWLHTRLADRATPVSMTTLSYWRSGARSPEGANSLRAVEEIEELLGLERGALSARIGPSSRVGPVPAPRMPFDEERDRIESEETLAAMRAAPQTSLRDLSTQMVVHVGLRGDIERTVTRALIQSTSGTISEIPLIAISPEETEEVSYFSDVLGGTVTRSYQHPGRRLSGIVIELDVPISAGETALIEFTEWFPATYPSTRYAWHGNTRPAREILLWVHFVPAAIPDWCEEYIETDAGEEFWPRRVVGRSVHATRHGFGPGVLGVRWGYEAGSVESR